MRNRRIDDIRAKDQDPGIRDYEANLLRLIERITNGTVVEIDETGAQPQAPRHPTLHAAPEQHLRTQLTSAADSSTQPRLAGTAFFLLRAQVPPVFTSFSSPSRRHEVTIQAGRCSRRGDRARLRHRQGDRLLPRAAAHSLALWEAGAPARPRRRQPAALSQPPGPSCTCTSVLWLGRSRLPADTHRRVTQPLLSTHYPSLLSHRHAATRRDAPRNHQ